MLNRRILRIKAFKVIYSLTENPSMSLKEGQKLLERSCEATRDLYLFLLALIPALTEEARNRIGAAKGKFNPSEEEKHPNMKFAENRLAPLFSEDPDFTRLLSRKKLSWQQYDVLLRHLYDALKGRGYYSGYMDSGKDSLKEDASLWKSFYENELEDNEELEKILEDLSVWWGDDLGYALIWCCRSMEELGRSGRWDLPPLYMSEINAKEESDRDFVSKLLRKSFAGYSRYVAEVGKITPQWDLGRICATDLALIVAGLAEAETFPDIPKKVTINEYVEISKYYSTPESRAFVNGILDKLIDKAL